jgi:hypothetical protein
MSTSSCRADQVPVSRNSPAQAPMPTSDPAVMASGWVGGALRCLSVPPTLGHHHNPPPVMLCMCSGICVVDACQLGPTMSTKNDTYIGTSGGKGRTYNCKQGEMVHWCW